MTASFFGSEIHPVYATFALVEHGEYAARQAIRSFLEPDEDAVGAAIELTHLAPTPVGWLVEIRATVVRIDGKTIDCEIIATNCNGIIARGRQQQRVVTKVRLQRRIADLYSIDRANDLPVRTNAEHKP
jgi:predicted thioesterase